MMTLADMIRDVYKNTPNSEPIRFRVAGFYPRRTENHPDPWEARALTAFEKGSREWFELTNADDANSKFRYMAPLVVEPQCVSCHADQAGKVGTVRGGISVFVPAGPFLASQSKEIGPLAVTYSLIWLVGFVGLAAGTHQLLRKSEVAKAAADASLKSEERFRRLFEEAPIAYHEIDANGTVLRINRAGCALLGFSPEHIVGRPIWEFVSPEERDKSREAVERKVSGKQALGLFGREYIRRDGTRLRMEIHENLIHDSRGAVLGIRSSMLDVTERERSERALAERTEELARSNADLEQFAYAASHDLQEPLRKILAFGDRLNAKSGDALGNQGRDYLERMQKAAGRMQALINDLLAFSRIKRRGQPFGRVDLSKVVQDVLSVFEVRMEQLGARVEVGNLPAIDADPMQMSQLFQNLIGNALKFHRQDEAPVVRILSHAVADREDHNQQNELCRISVEDQGIGFDEKYLDRIFQVFQRLHGRTQYEGTGIGLAICRHIVERHGGSLTAKSAPGEGAKFIVTLPVSQPAGETRQ
jgi:PAS domain S-box-containing protein